MKEKIKIMNMFFSRGPHISLDITRLATSPIISKGNAKVIFHANVPMAERVPAATMSHAAAQEELRSSFRIDSLREDDRTPLCT